mmetsp:Transcript_9971/g.14330  ORF Transcript_9971/g.14330 Transcript_9971/m.14330 type:complete len:98 (-) Transcript_9971:1294-1587(-)
MFHTVRNIHPFPLVAVLTNHDSNAVAVLGRVLGSPLIPPDFGCGLEKLKLALSLEEIVRLCGGFPKSNVAFWLPPDEGAPAFKLDKGLLVNPPPGTG